MVKEHVEDEPAANVQEGDAGWAEIGFEDVELGGVTREEFNATWGKHMRLFAPEFVPEGAVCYRLVRLRLETKGWMAQHAYIERPGGAPDPGCTVIQGWRDGPELEAGQAPPPGQPPGYPNRGNASAANASGVAEWIWGGGGFDPAKTEGPFWYWCSVPGCYSDVACGFWWRWGTEHYKLEPVFQRVEPGEPPVVPPGDGDLARIEGKLDELLLRLFNAGVALEGVRPGG
jgi:hypothetical protein